jgi:SAM-dependent methyltransferase
VDKELSNSARWYSADYGDLSATAIDGSLSNRVLHKFLEKGHENNEGLTILEVGANKGEHLKYVKPGWKMYYSTDLHLPNNQKLLSNGNVVVEIQNVEDLKYPDKEFDRVIATCLFHHLSNPEHAAREILRVTKIGGVISILIPNDPGVLYRVLRSMTTLRAARKKSKVDEIQLIHAREHRNHYLSLFIILKFVFKSQSVQIRQFPFGFKGYNLNALTVFEITKIANLS